jgi:iron transport multicopper oxidase
MLKLLFITVGLCQIALCGFYQWDITWVDAAPDGFNRPVIGINGKWPPPVLEATVGEKITVVVTNKLANETTTIHWHGIQQLQSNVMDGLSGVTQCAIPPGEFLHNLYQVFFLSYQHPIDGIFTYSFTLTEPGTYWYRT